MARFAITPTISINESELHESFIHAGGPGGQNVNKVATAVQLRFDVMNSPSLDEGVKRRLRMLAGRKMTTDGVLILFARNYRTQERNRMDARARLADLIQRASVRPVPRIATKPSGAARRQRLFGKKVRSAIKEARAKPSVE